MRMEKTEVGQDPTPHHLSTRGIPEHMHPLSLRGQPSSTVCRRMARNAMKRKGEAVLEHSKHSLL